MNYKQNISEVYRKLSITEQRELYEKIQEGDKEARNTLISGCLPLVVKIAEKFHFNNRHIDLDDIIQEGNVALIKSIDKWNPDISGSITTLAWYSITNALINMIHKGKYKIKNPFSLSAYAGKIIDKINSCESDDPEVVANEIGVSSSTVKKMMNVNYTKRTALFKDSVQNKTEEESEPSPFCLGDLVGLANCYLTEPNKTIFLEYHGIKGKKKKIATLSQEHQMAPKQVLSILNKSKTHLKKMAKEGLINDA